ncbi:MAG: hypothetical protein OXI96_05220 [Acidimicrobiaceae bacterium]|nr:hypothetical protein [Acidimicrobiaceae bacterium]
MLDHFKNPVLALELSRWYKNKAFVIGIGVMYAVMLNPILLFSFFLRFSPIVDALHLIEEYLDSVSGNGSYFSFVIPHSAKDISFLRGSHGLIVLVLGLTVLVVPALAATSIVGERRRGTLMPVQLSLLRPFDIVWGKVVASVAPIVFPAGVYAVALVLTSWNVRQLFLGVGGVLVLVGAVFFVSAVSVLISTFAMSSAVAVVLSYGMAFMVWLVLAFALAVDNMEWFLGIVFNVYCEVVYYDFDV